MIYYITIVTNIKNPQKIRDERNTNFNCKKDDIKLQDVDELKDVVGDERNTNFNCKKDDINLQYVHFQRF